MIQIISYNNINGVRFGSSAVEVIAYFGQPLSQRKNHAGELEFYFSNFILRFNATSECLRECTLLPESNASINNNLIVWTKDFLSWLASEDLALMETLGFVVSMKLGIAVTGFHDGDEPQKAIHAFARGDWDMFRNGMRMFTLPA